MAFAISMKYIEYILKHNIVLLNIYKAIFSAMFTILGKFISTDPHLILFSSYMGKLFNDSPKVLYDYIKSHKEYSGYKCVWSFKDPKKFSDIGCKVIKQDSIIYFYYTLKAKYWITNVNIERGLHYKKKDKIYVNTWHGTGPKVDGNTQKGRNDYDFSNIDILLADGDYLKNIFVKSFKANPNNIFLFGRPREDRLFAYLNGQEGRLCLLEKHGMRPDKKYILYAPTWRDSVDKGDTYGLDVLFDLNKWVEVLGEEYVILFRAHSITNIYKKYDNKNIIDVSNWNDINDLYIIADILVSDYSSCFTDFSILEKPMFCYAPDYDSYKESRGFNYDMDTFFTSGVIRDENALLDIIKDINFEEEVNSVRRYKEAFIQSNGNATAKTLELMFSYGIRI